MGNNSYPPTDSLLTMLKYNVGDNEWKIGVY